MVWIFEASYFPYGLNGSRLPRFQETWCTKKEITFPGYVGFPLPAMKTSSSQPGRGHGGLTTNISLDICSGFTVVPKKFSVSNVDGLLLLFTREASWCSPLTWKSQRLLVFGMYHTTTHLKFSGLMAKLFQSASLVNILESGSISTEAFASSNVKFVQNSMPAWWTFFYCVGASSWVCLPLPYGYCFFLTLYGTKFVGSPGSVEQLEK